MFWLSTLLSILFMQPEFLADDEAFVEQVEGACVIRDFGARLDGDRRGFKIWVGDRQQIAHSYSSGTGRSRDQNVIMSIGSIRREDDVGLSSVNYISFLDGDGNLVCCSGVSRTDANEPTPRSSVAIPSLMPIPFDVNEAIVAYKIAYYESGLPVVQSKVSSTIDSFTTGSDSDEEVKLTFPRWKSDGEMRGSKLEIREGARLILKKYYDNWKAETTEGRISFKSLGDGALENEKVSLPVGNSLSLLLKCRVDLDSDRSLRVWRTYVNPTPLKKKFYLLYVSFFDSDGNLVCCTGNSSVLEARPAIASVDGDPDGLEVVGYQALMTMPIPIGFSDKIVSYKLTVYEAGHQFGGVSQLNPIE